MLKIKISVTNPSEARNQKNILFLFFLGGDIQNIFFHLYHVLVVVRNSNPQ
jgi:hypothetical protein